MTNIPLNRALVPLPKEETNPSARLDKALPHELVFFKDASGRTRKLTDRQLRIVDLLLTNEHTTDTALGLAAGAPTEDAARHCVRRTLSLPHVQQYLVEQAKSRLLGLSGLSIKTIERLMTSARSERVQADVAMDLLDRIGARAPEQKEVNVRAAVSFRVDLS